MLGAWRFSRSEGTGHGRQRQPMVQKRRSIVRNARAPVWKRCECAPCGGGFVVDHFRLNSFLAIDWYKLRNVNIVARAVPRSGRC
jgi:hypothetical protein